MTQASSGAKPSTWSFSFSRDLEERKMGKLVSSTPISSMWLVNHFRMVDQMCMVRGRSTKKPEISW